MTKDWQENDNENYMNEGKKKDDKALENFNSSIFLLRIFYSKILEILNVFVGQYITSRNPEINDKYTILSLMVDDILNEDGFKKLKKEKPELFESLIGDIKEVDIEWECYYEEKAYDFLGKIEKLYISSGSPVFDLQKELKIFLKETDESIKKHKKYCDEKWQSMEIKIREQAKIFNKQFNESIDDKTIKENNYQKKDKILENSNNPTRKLKFPHKIPAGTRWENFIIKFLDEENVSIKVMQHKKELSYKEMGFVDGRYNTKQPSVGWTFLRVLAKCNGEIAIKDPESRDTYKKQKELVAKTLQSYFGIEYDPFYPYEPFPPHKMEKSYKIKITLIPSSESERSFPPEKKEEKKSLEDQIKESYDKQTPQKWDKYQQ